jgi:hypothetical protein
VKSQVIARYDAPHQFEPLMPSEAAMGPLLERASGLYSAQALTWLLGELFRELPRKT